MPLNYPSKPWTNGMTFLNGTVEYIYNSANNMWTFGAVGKGDQGIQGVSGLPGPYYTPSVDISGNISWINNGGLINPGTVNIKGADGPNGMISAAVISSFTFGTLVSGVLTLNHDYGNVSMFGGLVDNGRNITLDNDVVTFGNNNIVVDLSQYNVTGTWQAFFVR